MDARQRFSPRKKRATRSKGKSRAFHLKRARENRRASERKKENGGRRGDREAILSMRVTTARKRIWAVESGKSKWVKRTNGSADVGRRCDFCRRGWRSQVSSCKRRMCARTTSASFLCLFPPPPPPPPSLPWSWDSFGTAARSSRHSFHFASTCHEEVAGRFFLSLSFRSRHASCWRSPAMWLRGNRARAWFDRYF